MLTWMAETGTEKLGERERLRKREIKGKTPKGDDIDSSIQDHDWDSSRAVFPNPRRSSFQFRNKNRLQPVPSVAMNNNQAGAIVISDKVPGSDWPTGSAAIILRTGNPSYLITQFDPVVLIRLGDGNQNNLIQSAVHLYGVVAEQQ